MTPERIGLIIFMSPTFEDSIFDKSYLQIADCWRNYEEDEVMADKDCQIQDLLGPIRVKRSIPYFLYDKQMSAYEVFQVYRFT